jgi:hypothetical protein
MKIGISGSWRVTDSKIEKDVRNFVIRTMAEGNSIVSGGALGVDWIATDQAMKIDPSCRSFKIILPTPLDVYERHYLNRAAEGVIDREQAEILIRQLQKIRDTRPESLHEMSHDVCTPETYFARNQLVIDECDELAAFQVNKSAGTQDAIDRAKAQGKNVMLFKYTVESQSP